MNATLTPRKLRTDPHSANTTGEQQLGASELVEVTSTSVYFDAVSSANFYSQGGLALISSAIWGKDWRGNKYSTLFALVVAGVGPKRVYGLSKDTRAFLCWPMITICM